MRSITEFIRRAIPRGLRRNNGNAAAGAVESVPEAAPARPQLRVITRDQHGISRRNISNGALRVLYRLNEAGFEAFLVGGAVLPPVIGRLGDQFGLRAGMLVLYLTLGWVTAVGLWARPIISNLAEGGQRE